MREGEQVKRDNEKGKMIKWGNKTSTPNTLSKEVVMKSRMIQIGVMLFLFIFISPRSQTLFGNELS